MSVTLRTRTLKSGNVQFYLDIYHVGKRRTETIFTVNPSDKGLFKEKGRLAEEIAKKRDLEISSKPYGIVPSYQKKANFIGLCESIAIEKPTGEKAWFNMIKHLKEFCKGSWPIAAVTESWLEEVKEYLLKQVSRNTAHTYFSKVKAAVNRAYKKGIISYNPSDKVS